MRPITPLAALSCLIFMIVTAEAQHCPPIDESYLGLVWIRHAAGEQALELTVEYAKTGGQPKEKATDRNSCTKHVFSEAAKSPPAASPVVRR